MVLTMCESKVDVMTLEEIQEKYLCMYPVEDLNFERLFPPDLSYSCCCERQEKLLQNTIASDTATKFPPKVSYTRKFLKLLIQQIEQQGYEVLQECYTSYTDLLAGKGVAQSLPCAVSGEGVEDGFYRTYSPWRGGRVTLRETSSVVTAGTTGLRTWQAAHVLLQHLLENPSIVEGKRVVELGAGVGLLGLGVVLRGLPVRYTFTDGHPAVLDSLRHNVALNLAGGGVEQHGEPDVSEWTHGDCLVRVAPLDWCCLDSARRVADCHVVLAADVVFDPRLFGALLKTLSFLLLATEKAATAEGGREATTTGCSPAPLPPQEPQRLALLAVTIRNEENYDHFLNCIAEHGLQLLSVEARTYREAPSQCGHTVRLLRLAPALS